MQQVGGWSNVQTKLLHATALDAAVRAFHKQGGYILGLCAGMILCRSRDGSCCANRTRLGLVDMTIDNNVLNGTSTVHLHQHDDEREKGLKENSNASAVEAELTFSDGPVVAVHGRGVEVLATTTAGQVVSARQGNVVVSAYHYGLDLHERFLRFICESEEDKRATNKKRSVDDMWSGSRNSKKVKKTGAHSDTLDMNSPLGDPIPTTSRV